MNFIQEQTELYIKNFAPPTQNNSRSIVRNDVKRICSMSNQKTAAWILESKYQFDADYDPWEAGMGLGDGEFN